MESRGHRPTSFTSSLTYGPLPSLPRFLTGTVSSLRDPFSDGFHTYALEWTPDWMRVYVDERVRHSVDVSLRRAKDSFWRRGGFPATARNGTREAGGGGGTVVVVENPWEGSGWSAPFDQGARDALLSRWKLMRG
jgi:hypothetical protein